MNFTGRGQGAPIVGLADQLARVAHFRSLDLPEVGELDSLVFWLLGPTVPIADAAVLWQGLRADSEHLWHLISDDWDEDDLDEIPEADWTRYSFATRQQETDHRYEITRARLEIEIESAVAYARLCARECARLGVR